MFILLRGPLASGKTTIAKALAQKLNAEYIGIDDLLKENGLDVIDPEEGCIPAKNFIKANELILPQAKELQRTGKTVIFDACFYHKEVIEHLTKNLDYPHFVFTLKCPLKLCIERDKQRPLSYGEGAAAAVHSLVSKFDYGINIDVSGKVDEAVEEIMEVVGKT